MDFREVMPRPETMALNGLSPFGQHLQTGRQSSNVEVAPPVDWAPETIQPQLEPLGFDFSSWPAALQDAFMDKAYGLSAYDMAMLAIRMQPYYGEHK